MGLLVCLRDQKKQRPRNQYSACTMDIVLVCLTGNQSPRKELELPMFTFGNSLAKAILYAKVKVNNFFDLNSRRITASVFSETQEGTDGSSVRLFWLLNLMFLASLVLLSPDKIAEVLPSARPNWLAFDWIQDVVEALGKLTPF